VSGSDHEFSVNVFTKWNYIISDNINFCHEKKRLDLTLSVAQFKLTQDALLNFVKICWTCPSILWSLAITVLNVYKKMTVADDLSQIKMVNLWICCYTNCHCNKNLAASIPACDVHVVHCKNWKNNKLQYLHSTSILIRKTIAFMSL